MFSKSEETSVIKTNVAKEKQPAANTLVSRTTEIIGDIHFSGELIVCLLYTSPSPRDS